MVFHGNSDVQFVEEHFEAESFVTLVLQLDQRRQPPLDQEWLLKFVADDRGIPLRFKRKYAASASHLLKVPRSLGLSQCHPVWLYRHHRGVCPSIW